MLKMHPGDERLLHFWPEIDIYESSIKETRFPLRFLMSFSHEHISPGYVFECCNFAFGLSTKSSKFIEKSILISYVVKERLSVIVYYFV